MPTLDPQRPLGRRTLLQRNKAGPRRVPRIGPACRDHRICVVLCPEGALVGFELEGRRGVALRLRDCTGCGHCLAACPEHAITLEARPEASAALLPLTAHEPRICEHCFEPFVGGPEALRCPACEKDANLFRARRASGSAPLVRSDFDQGERT